MTDPRPDTPDPDPGPDRGSHPDPGPDSGTDPGSDTGTDPGSAPHRQPAGDEERAAGPRPTADPDGPGAHGPRPGVSSALAQVARAAPPRPPRRTGVFVDPDDLREHVGALLRSILGGYEVDAFGNFTFVHEGARVFVTIGTSPIGPHVGVFCVTNVDLELSAELGAFLLTTNHRLGFGSFSYDPSNRAVWLRHTLLGTTLDVPELQAAVAAVSTTAAGLDDTIKERFGGRRFQDAPSELQRRMEPPEPSDPPPNASGYL